MSTLAAAWRRLDSWNATSLFYKWHQRGLEYGQIINVMFLQVAVIDFLTLVSAQAPLLAEREGQGPGPRDVSCNPPEAERWLSIRTMCASAQEQPHRWVRSVALFSTFGLNSRLHRLTCGQNSRRLSALYLENGLRSLCSNYRM